MTYNSTRKVHGDECHIFVTVDVSLAGGQHRLRLVVDDVIHDRQVVRGEVPDDIYVVLEQSEVHAKRVVVVQVAQGPRIDQFADLLDRACEQERMVDHDHKL